MGTIVKLQWIDNKRLGKRDSKAMTAKLGIDIVVRKLVWFNVFHHAYRLNGHNKSMRASTLKTQH